LIVVFNRSEDNRPAARKLPLDMSPCPSRTTPTVTTRPFRKRTFAQRDKLNGESWEFLFQTLSQNRVLRQAAPETSLTAGVIRRAKRRNYGMTENCHGFKGVFRICIAASRARAE
jgi:hypothetical protein